MGHYRLSTQKGSFALIVFTYRIIASRNTSSAKIFLIDEQTYFSNFVVIASHRIVVYDLNNDFACRSFVMQYIELILIASSVKVNFAM